MSLIGWLRSQDPKQVAKVYRPNWDRNHTYITILTQSHDGPFGLLTFWHQL